MESSDKNLLEEVDFHIKDIGFSVNQIYLSKVLPQASHLAYINIETKEQEKFTVQLSMQGFQVVGHEFDSTSGPSVKYPNAYETIYASLEAISSSYTKSFSNALADKLNLLNQTEELKWCRQDFSLSEFI